MRILVICNCASGLYDFRGMLLRQMISTGHTISAVIPIEDLPEEKFAESELKSDDVRLIYVPMERRGMNPLKDFELLKTYIRTIKEEKPELVITYTIKPNIYGGIASQMCGVPYAANITGLGTAFQGSGILKQFVIALYRIALRQSKVVFFENCENMQIIMNEGIIKKNQAFLLNGAGVDLDEFSLQPYPIDMDETRFLFIGRVMREKGIDELFSAMRKLVDEGGKCSLDILGGFDEDYSEIIKKYEKEGWLRYRGYQNDIRPFIKNCHCFVLPSWHEGMANTNLECAASGRPVITSNIHGCLEAVEDEVSGYLCEKQNADDLYRVMKKFTKLSYDERKAMGLAGRKHMEEVFDKKKVVEDTIRRL